jgi:hypothetical protein
MASKKKAIIFDLNKTLRKDSGEPKKHILKKAEKYEKKEKVIVLSGEQAKDYSDARLWLNEHHLNKADLKMRPQGDVEHDEVEKEHLLNKISRQFRVEEAYDDKPANLKMFKKHGIKAKEV